MSFITDFLEYNSGTECPRNYLLWSALSAISVAAGRRFVLCQGRLEVRPNTYICLVGDQGNRKSFAKDQARDLISEALVDMPIGADITTRDDLMKLLASDNTCRFYINHDGAEVEWHPLSLFINELKHFMSYNPSSMISFVVDIYDRRVFRGSTIKRGAEDVPEPCLNILACENPDWMINNLKYGVITGGFSRRFIVVYEPENKDPNAWVARPYLPPNSDQLWSKMKSHLVKLYQLPGRKYSWGLDSEKFFDDWYYTMKKSMPDDPIIRGFMRTKDQQLLKVCMLLDLAEDEPTFTLTPQLITVALGLFSVIEPNMPKLYVAAGRNELAVPQQRMIEMLENNHGMTKVDLLKKTDKDLNPMEQKSMLIHLEETERVFRRMVELSDGSVHELYLSKTMVKTVDRNKGKWPKGVVLKLGDDGGGVEGGEVGTSG